jgi:hypothetical protein
MPHPSQQLRGLQISNGMKVFFDLHFLPQIHHGKKGRIAVIAFQFQGFILKIEDNGFFYVPNQFIKGFALAENIKIKTSGAIKIAIMIDFNLDHFFHNAFQTLSIKIPHLSLAGRLNRLSPLHFPQT